MKRFIKDHLLTTLIILGSLLLNYLDKPNWAIGILVLSTIVFHYGMHFFIHCYIGATGEIKTPYSEVKAHKYKGKNLLR